MVALQTACKQLVEQHPAALGVRRAVRTVDLPHQQQPPGGTRAHLACRRERAKRAVQLAHLHRVPHAPARELPVFAQRHGKRMRPRVHRRAHCLRQLRRCLAVQAVLPLLPGQLVFCLRLADIQAVFVDKRLHHGIDEHGNIQPAIDIVSDARGADGLIKHRQRQHAQPSADDGRERLPRLVRLLAAAENDVVILRRRAGLAAAIGGRAADHVAARHKIQLPLRQQTLQQRQIARHGDVDGNIVREEVGIPLVGGGDHGDLPPQELGKRLFAPRKLVDRQIHLKAQRADVLHDLLVPGGKRVERAGEERRGLLRRKRQRAALDLIAHEKAVEMVEHRRVVKAHGLPRARLAQEREQLFVQPRKQRPAERERQRIA